MRFKFLGSILDKWKLQKREEQIEIKTPLIKIEPLEEIKYDNKGNDNLFAELAEVKKKIQERHELCEALIAKYEAISDFEYKVHETGYTNLSLLTEYKSRLETFLRLLSNRKGLDELYDLLDNINNYFHRIEISLPTIESEINRKYFQTVVDPNYRFDGSKVSKWREEAEKIFLNSDLSFYNDYQLKEYVVAYKNGVDIDFLNSIMNPKRAPEHIRLMLLLPPDKLLEVINHPEYSVDRIKCLFPDMEFGNKKRT